MSKIIITKWSRQHYQQHFGKTIFQILTLSVQHWADTSKKYCIMGIIPKIVSNFVGLNSDLWAAAVEWVNVPD